LPQGIEIGLETGARADLYVVDDDNAFANEDLRFAPSAKVTLRWPWGKQQNNGTSHLIEPVVQLSWAQSYGGTPPNEDSTRTELDRGNLLDESRFAGDDAVQTGGQIVAGLNWTRIGAQGGYSTLSFGRVFRQEAQSDFTASSGLDGARSDWLIAGQIVAPGGFLIGASSLWDDSDGLNSAAARVTWRNDWVTLGGNYNWQTTDLNEDRPDTVSEITFDSAFQITDAWKLELDGRYDVAADRAVNATAGIQWRNECVTIDVSASRRFTSSSTVDPTTTFGISGSIGGFSTGRATGGVATGCGN
jgi:LPS-assembly protein